MASGSRHVVLRDLPSSRPTCRVTSPSIRRSDTCSIPITRGVGARHPRPDRGLLSRPPGLRGHRLSRPTWTGRWGRLFETLSDDAWAEPAELIELGLNHEQQHQELLLMDIKHVLSRNPLRPAYRPRNAREAAAAPGDGLDGARGRARPARGRGHRLRLRQRAAAASRRAGGTFASPTARSPTASTAPSSRTADTETRCCGSPTAGRRCRPRGGRRPLYWRETDGERSEFNPRRRGSARPRRAGLPCEPLRGPPPTRPGPASACPPRPNGRPRRPGWTRRTPTCWPPTACIPRRRTATVGPPRAR